MTWTVASGFEAYGMVTIVDLIPSSFALRMFAPKSPRAQIFFTLATKKGNDKLLPERERKIAGHRLRFGENMPGKIP